MKLEDLIEYDPSFTERDIKEIRHCLNYALWENHGTDGHLKANVIAKLAIELHRLSGDESIIWDDIEYDIVTMKSKFVYREPGQPTPTG